MSKKRTNENTVKVPVSALVEMIIDIHDKDIKDTIHFFLKTKGMPMHLMEDIVQEAVILLMERLPRYDYTKSALRTYIINTAKIASLRYRTEYYKLYVPEWEINYDVIEDVTYNSEEDVLRGLDLNDYEVAILMDRYNGYTFKEIQDKYGESSRQVYKIIDKFSNKYEESLDN